MNTKSEKERFLLLSGEFAAVATEYNHFLEKTRETDLKNFLSTSHKLLSLLYLKALLLPDAKNYNSDEIEKFVTEEEWNYIKTVVNHKIKSLDQYDPEADLIPGKKPVENTTISEDLADIYQDTKDFTSLFNMGVYEMIYDAVGECKNNFKMYWGIKALNAMKTLHKLMMKEDKDLDEISDEFNNQEWEANEDGSAKYD